MGSERRIFIYGRYYRGEEAIIDTEFQNTGGGESSTEFDDRPETFMHRGQSAYISGINTSLRDNSFDFGPDQRNMNANHQAYGGLVGNSMGYQQSGYSIRQPGHSMRQPGHSVEFGLHQSVHVGNHCHQNSGYSSSSNRDFQGYGSLMGNSISYAQPPHTMKNQQPAHTVESDPHQMSYQVVHIGTDHHQYSGPSSRPNSDYRGGYGFMGNSMGYQQQAHSVESDPHHQMSHQARVGIAANNHYPPKSGLTSNDLQGYGGVIGSLGCQQRTYQPASPQAIQLNNRYSRYNEHNFESAGSSIASNGSAQCTRPTETYNRSKQDDKDNVVVNFASYGNDQLLSNNDKHMRESDETTNLERSKLISRISYYYELNAPLIFSKNRDKFEKTLDWVKVCYVCCEGLKTYRAEMNCPLCFGQVKPQNKNKKAGMLPSWDLTPVVRHIDSFHKENENGEGGKRGKKTLKREQSSKKIREKYEETIENSDEKDEAIEKVKPFNGKNEEATETSESSVESALLVEKANSNAQSLDNEAQKASKELIGVATVTSEPKNETNVLLVKEVDSKAKPFDNEQNLNDKKGEKKVYRPLKSSRDRYNSSSDSSSDSSLDSSDSSSDSSSGSSDSSSSSSSLEKTVHKKHSRKQINMKKLIKNKKKPGKQPKKMMKNKKKKMREVAKKSESEDDNPGDSSSSDDDVAAWAKPGVTFGWVKLTKTSKFQPAFIYPKEKGQEKQDAQYIMTKGGVSQHKHPIEVNATAQEIERAMKSKKSVSYLKAIQLFNAEQKTNF